MSYVCYQTEELRNERIAKKVTQKKNDFQLSTLDN